MYLNIGERYIIEYSLRDGEGPARIARKLGRHRSTIIREIRSGSCQQWSSAKAAYVEVYFADTADRLARQRQAMKGMGLKIGRDIHTAALLESLIRDKKWSPDAALGWARVNSLLLTDISTPTLYKYIKEGVLAITEHHLPRQGMQRKKKQKEYRTAHKNVRGTSIEQRPESVLKRDEFGHWEGDLVVGKKGTRNVVLTLVERKTRNVITARFSSKEKAHVIGFLDYLEKVFGDDFYRVFKSVTYDNGSEFLDFEAMERSIHEARGMKRTQVYYAHPYCSCERGSNENANGLLRRAGIKKGTDIGLLSDGDIEEATKWVNDLPRKLLGYKSAAQAFEEELASL
jgi:IS30 family transposase